MSKVKVVSWMGKDFGGDFKPLSATRSLLEVDAEKGSTVKSLFGQLTERYDYIGKAVFCKETQNFYPDIVVIFNDRMIRVDELYNTVLQEGDCITILPLYVGG
jgi:molybdopterin converting factor small subunit